MNQINCLRFSLLFPLLLFSSRRTIPHQHPGAKEKYFKNSKTQAHRDRQEVYEASAPYDTKSSTINAPKEGNFNQSFGTNQEADFPEKNLRQGSKRVQENLNPSMYTIRGMYTSYMKFKLNDLSLKSISFYI